PTLAGETETYLAAKAVEEGFVMDGHPLVRFIAEDNLKRGKFEVVAELVASPIVEQLRNEEMERYGIARTPRGAVRGTPSSNRAPGQGSVGAGYAAAGAGSGHGAPARQPYAFVPEEDEDYSFDYGEYAFNDQDLDDYYQEMGAYDDALMTPDFPEDRLKVSEPFESPRASSAPFAGNDGANGAMGLPLGAPGPVPGTGLGALPGVLAGASMGAIPSMVPGSVPGALPGNLPDSAYGAPGNAVPNTVVFAGGSGNARPLPQVNLARASLLCVNDNRSFDLGAPRLLMGRDSTSDIEVDDINASRTHAELRQGQSGVWIINDLGSTNGTLVNGKEVTTQALRDGDYLTIGMTNYVFIQP
ncbi:MAG: FHA domain-containing protein, partial [Coriobacteriaceae bacterium]|nr:FHA domain-containing protein [Coriobacteriaceae bacterium]